MAFACLNISTAFKKPTGELCKSSGIALLRNILPDSVYSFVKNKPIIFYSYGHYGYSWAVLARSDEDFRAFSGRVNYSGDKFLTEQMEANQFDSTAFFSVNNELLSWAFDSLSAEAYKMQAVMPKRYVTLYSDLSVIDACGVGTFNSNNAETFSGPDSLEFNRKYQKLILLMRWLSSPDIRQFIPDNAINQIMLIIRG